MGIADVFPLSQRFGADHLIGRIIESKLEPPGHVYDMWLFEDAGVVSRTFKYLWFVEKAFPGGRWVPAAGLRPISGLQIKNAPGVWRRRITHSSDQQDFVHLLNGLGIVCAR